MAKLVFGARNPNTTSYSVINVISYHSVLSCFSVITHILIPRSELRKVDHNHTPYKSRYQEACTQSSYFDKFLAHNEKSKFKLDGLFMATSCIMLFNIHSSEKF